MSKFAKLTFLFYLYVKSANLPFFYIFKMNFDYDPEGILKKGKHFQLTVFSDRDLSTLKFLVSHRLKENSR